MNNKIKIILLTIILILSWLLINQMKYPNDELSAVNLKNKLDKDLVSILVSDGSENYIKYEGSTFPSNTEYTYNGELSKCQDNNGNVIEGILSYNEESGKVSIRTKKTTYCYLYFDKLSSSFAEELIASGELWQSGLEGDGYRYTGSGNATASTTPKNFICFGTTSLTECKANEEKYMYRIIGVFPDESGKQQLKLIKYKQLGAYQWHSDENVDVPWEESDLFYGLNGINGGYYSNLFIGNTTYDYLQDNTWLNRIVDWKWTATNTLSCGEDGLCNEATSGPDYTSIATFQMYQHEMNKTKSNEECMSNYFTGGTCDFNIGEWTYPIAKIGLMYVSDYQMSLGNSSLTMIIDNDYETLQTGWLHQSNNDTTAETYEWFMSRVGSGSSGNFKAWVVYDDGNVGGDTVAPELGTRPVFYLDSTVTTSGGTGEYSNPYLIQE